MKNRCFGYVKVNFGFTLVELLLVLAFMAISVATIVPRLGYSISNRQARESAKCMLAAIKLAQQAAQTRQEVMVFVLDANSTGFSLRSLGALGDANRANSEFWLPSQFFGKGVEVVQLDGFEDVGDEKWLTFWPDGSASKGHIVLGVEKQREADKWDIFVGNDGTVALQGVQDNE